MSRATELADELDAMSERITRYSNSPGDGLCAEAAEEMRRLDRVNAELVEALDTTNAALEAIGDYAHDRSTGPAVWDPYWEIRAMAYDNVCVVDAAITSSGDHL